MVRAEIPSYFWDKVLEVLHFDNQKESLFTQKGDRDLSGPSILAPEEFADMRDSISNYKETELTLQAILPQSFGDTFC